MSGSRRTAALTDVGRRRLVNEDAYYFDNDLGVYVVADGMGGHAAGEVASQQAVETVYGMLKRDAEKIDALASAEADEAALRHGCRMMESAIQAATYMVYGIALNQPDQKGMGTTVSAMLITGSIGISAQVGDSRVYRVRNGVAEPITEDHTLVAWQIKQGIITEEQAERSPHRNVITRAVGSKDYVQVDTNVVDVAPGDRYLICSDGLHGYLSEDEVAEISAIEPEEAATRFIALANERGGKDNITAIVVHVDGI